MSEWKSKRLDEIVQFQRGHDLTLTSLVLNQAWFFIEII